MSALMTLAAVFTGTLAAAPAGGAADEPGAVERELMRLENGAMERWRKGDPMGWAEIAAPEVTYVDPGLPKPIVGLEAYSRYLGELKGKILYDGSEFVRPKVAVYGDMAVLTFNYQATTRQADGTEKRHAPWNTTEIYARLGGAWKIIHTHWSYINHVLPDQVEIPLPVELQDKADEGVAGELLALERAAMLRWRRGDPSGLRHPAAHRRPRGSGSGVPEARGHDSLRGDGVHPPWRSGAWRRGRPRLPLPVDAPAQRRLDPAAHAVELHGGLCEAWRGLEGRPQPLVADRRPTRGPGDAGQS
jgi:ketosteroid isomerase-like protein